MAPQAADRPQVQEPIKELEETRVLVSDSRLYKIPLVTEVWLLVLGVSALFDFLSTILPKYFLPEDDEFKEEKENPFLFRKKEVIVESNELWDQAWYIDLLEWLDRNSTELSVLFSVLWFVHAFVCAHRHRLKKLRERDRERLMETEPGQPIKTERGILDLSEYDNWLTGGWGHFFATVSLQLVLLPVGFYLLWIHIARGVFDGDLDHLTGDEKIEISYSNTDDMPEFRETLSTHTTQSVAYAIIHHISIIISHVAGAQIMAVKKHVKKFGMRMTRRLAFIAVKNPKRFARRVRKILTVVRWVKYLFPLVGAGNKLLGNIKDLIKKGKQKRAAAKAEIARRQLWKHLTDEERQEAAALVIQSKWRAYKTEKAVKALKIFTGEKETLAAIRMQKKFRAMLARARARLKKKKEELRKLQEEENKRMLEDKGHLSAKKRRRMYKLQDEVGAKEKQTLNRKLLLRPNTTFAVTWKILFVICVILDIAQLAAKPTLQRYKKEMPGETVSTEKVLEYKLVPTPFEETEVCSLDESLNTKGPRVFKRIRNWQKKRRDAKRGTTHRPWYCDNPIAIIAQSMYIVSLKFFLEESVILIGLVCFLDVPVTFWTGEFDERGTLVPKPFFARWILPGLVLQLLVNPAMGEVSKVVKQMIKGSMEVGPVRVARWSMALFIPALEHLVSWLEYAVWLPLTINQNYRVWKKRSY